MEQIYMTKDIYELTNALTDQLTKIANELVAALPDAPMLLAADYIQRNYRQNLSVESVAQALHYNSAYFGRKFKNYFGESFLSYLEKQRIEKAKRLLLEDYKIYQISEMVGFSSVDYFSEIFRLHVGVSPTQYRQRHINE